MLQRLPYSIPLTTNLNQVMLLEELGLTKQRKMIKHRGLSEGEAVEHLWVVNKASDLFMSSSQMLRLDSKMHS
jgi:hypothetical protein